MTSTTRSNRLILLNRDSLTETWLAATDGSPGLSTRAAVTLVRREFYGCSQHRSALGRVASAIQLDSGARPRGEDATWAIIEAALLRRRLTVRVLARPLPRTDPPIPFDPPVEPPAPPLPPAPIIDDDRALFLLRCDPELLANVPLKFEYMLRGLAGQPVELRIVSDRFPGELVHQRMLTAAQTQDRVHADTWDGIVTVSGELQGKRLPAEYGPCVVEIVHDASYRDRAEFTLGRVVVSVTLDGLFHTGSAMLSPTRPARGGTVASRPFDNRDELPDWLAQSAPFQPPRWYSLRETIGPSFLAQILSECGGDHNQRGLILAGHTSAAGSNALNDELADARARCVWSLLMGDINDFESSLEDFWVIEDAYVMLRYCAQMYAWPCDPGEPRPRPDAEYREAVRGFQTNYSEAFESSIDVDGEVGPQTRGAFFEIYQAVLAGAFGGQAGLDHHRGQLRVHGSSPTVSCGERYLAGVLRSGAGIDDRRVEALLFLPDEPIPADAAAIYEHETFRFAEWFLHSEPQSPAGNIEQTFDQIEPPRESSDTHELDVYEPIDLDDPWDFLNAFQTVTNQGGVRDE